VSTHPEQPATVPAPVGPAGVIHDIGYRRYAGARLGRAYILRSLFVQSLRSTYGLGRTAKSKILPFLLLGAISLPAVVIVAVLVFARLPSLPLPYERYIIVTQAVIAIFAASQAPQLFSRDLRFRTVTLYFSRPLTRIDYVAAKYAALVVSLTMLMLAPLLILFVGTLLAKLPAAEQAREFGAAVVGAVVLALVLAAVAGLIASMTTRRGFGVAAIITVLLVSYGGVNVGAQIASFGSNESVAGYLGVLSPVTLVDGLQVLTLGGESSSAVPPTDGPVGILAYVLATVLVVAGSFGLLLLRHRKVAAS
jgi:ABC-2 type transport system permease protein